ncbi:actin cytoskeleton-regulatory complex protein PAN1-like [Momordica charantia]|uniref:Actin cytoskeleton-regulatory complex protein PAN1-like n=1 Tax=Momordica charantia TaxID=3673 RepID=A0A6J1DHC0_MOMCH|nr:actin cytoskeleton-regulatory complex protein PAN1-like [Momordica charantia]
MDAHRSPVLTWAYFLQAKNIDELRHSLLCTTVELEQTRIAVQEELKKRDDQISHLKDLLTQAIRERDEANQKSEKLLQKLLFPAPAPPVVSAISTIEDEPRRGIDFSSSDCEESIVSSPIPAEIAADWLPEKPLPEKGSLLQAVVKAGPLLQTLLLAGPLPQWRHPPPPLESFQLPPIAIPLPPPPPPQALPSTNCGIVNKKRACEELESPTATKLQRLLFH